MPLTVAVVWLHPHPTKADFITGLQQLQPYHGLLHGHCAGVVVLAPVRAGMARASCETCCWLLQPAGSANHSSMDLDQQVLHVHLQISDDEFQSLPPKHAAVHAGGLHCNVARLTPSCSCVDALPAAQWPAPSGAGCSRWRAGALSAPALPAPGLLPSPCSLSSSRWASPPHLRRST